MRDTFCLLILLGILSCNRTELDTVEPEYRDWYTLKSPIDQQIQGVWGDRDNTLLIATTFNIFRSTDQGRNWQEVDSQQSGISGIIEYRDTLFAMNGLMTEQDRQVFVNAGKYSVDDGKSWTPYRKVNLFFDKWSAIGPVTHQQLYANPVIAPNGLSYKINQVFVDSPMATSGHFETPGVITSDGREIVLPQLHQLRSLYLDSKQRLYISGTDAVCGRGGKTGEPFSFCNSRKGRGVVYISKNPLP
ncbi:hypothetical protein [Telluribacter sp. SYSU D00476]|uniref:hypothetical protein n=1 Tax=Telluribacter sp. SYSU D00476 TaxID=2811430 RepID=UPI001FF6409E|nr:hypothetical protein [Telluribacter sp. SYSU D00476]